MKYFVLEVNGKPVESFPEFVSVEISEGQFEDIPISERFHPDFLATLVEYDHEPDLTPKYEPPVPAPVMQVTKRQAVLALYDAGKLDALNAALDAAGPRAKLEWDTVSVIERNSSLVQQLAPALGLDLDALFLAAAAIPD